MKTKVFLGITLVMLATLCLLRFGGLYMHSRIIEPIGDRLFSQPDIGLDYWDLQPVPYPVVTDCGVNVKEFKRADPLDDFGNPDVVDPVTAERQCKISRYRYNLIKSHQTPSLISYVAFDKGFLKIVKTLNGSDD